jgi:peptide-methionine (R)-S-oxide reductase
MSRTLLVVILLLLIAVPAVALAASSPTPMPAGSKPAVPTKTEAPVGRVTKSEEEWKKLLTPQQYHVLREKGTEIAFTGKYWNEHAAGTYVCAACGLELFNSNTKFDSGTGWPSFWAPIAKNHVVEIADHSLGMERIEVNCARCGGHLGHVFDDGPAPTGLRYCMNSVSLAFKPSH